MTVRAPVRGANSCGFFGSPATRNLCSKGFRDSLRHAGAHRVVVHSHTRGARHSASDVEGAGGGAGEVREGKEQVHSMREEGGADGFRVLVRRGVLRCAPLL